MEHSKLMMPLFCGGFFNREGRKMRAVFEKEISDGTQTYRLWRGTGKSDTSYPRAENDKYNLYAEVNGYLLPLQMTEFFLVDRCGFEVLVKEWYGNSKERSFYFDNLRRTEGDAGVQAVLEAERQEIERLGNDPARQTNYIRRMLDKWVAAYLEAKENGGKTFPNFIGALILNELSNCAALSEVYKAQRQEKELAHAAHVAEAGKAFCDGRNKEAEEAVSKALQIIRDGGVLENNQITFYRSKYDHSTYSIVNYLMQLYQVNVPLRTQGWINERLANVTIQDGKCEFLQYLRSQNGRCSQKFFECMDELIQAVMTKAPPKKVEAL